MAIRAWVPAAGPFAQLQREMNRVFDSVFGQHFGPVSRTLLGYVYPPVNVRETGDHYLIECDIKEVKPDLNTEFAAVLDSLTPEVITKAERSFYNFLNWKKQMKIVVVETDNHRLQIFAIGSTANGRNGPPAPAATGGLGLSYRLREEIP